VVVGDKALAEVSVTALVEVRVVVTIGVTLVSEVIVDVPVAGELTVEIVAFEVVDATAPP
jgi:hypothetical protein